MDVDVLHPAAVEAAGGGTGTGAAESLPGAAGQRILRKRRRYQLLEDLETRRMLCYFQIDDPRMHRMLEYLFTMQMNDQGWNCERPRGATHSSFHTTISVLEGYADLHGLLS